MALFVLPLWGLGFLWLLVWPFDAHADNFRIALPVECEMGVDCVLQHYVDHNTAQGDEAYHDFTCGSLSYDGHKGTDIRAVNEAVMEKGIPVLAAATGTVLATRTNVGDKTPAEAGKECGNGVLLDHGYGWKTHYCHLRHGSVRVQEGDVVKTGETLGLMGMSGSTVFPHLHLQITKYNAVIDPYVGISGYECGSEARISLWDEEAKPQVEYVRTGLLGAGFASQRPKQAEIWAGQHRLQQLQATSPLLVGWVELFGLRRNDVLLLELKSPDGRLIAKHRDYFDRHKIRWFIYVGAKRPENGWQAGEYRLSIRVLRQAEEGGKIVLELDETRTVTVQ